MSLSPSQTASLAHTSLWSFTENAGGGLTVPSNLRILQWQACKKKHSKLEFLIPWWDIQLGISVNQFLSIFASSNSDFRWVFVGFYVCMHFKFKNIGL